LEKGVESLRASFVRTALAVSAVVLIASSASLPAQAMFPDRSVRIVVAFGVGGTTDVIARVIGQKLSALWHQPVVIENRPGASGNLAAVVVGQASPDGYTLLLATQSLAVNVTFLPSQQIDPMRDLDPITLVARAPSILIVPPHAPYRTLTELVAYSNLHPDELTYGSAGVGTVGHLGVELLKQQTGLKATHVPYNAATTQAYADVATGRLSLMLPTIAGYIPQIKAGLFRALAVSGQTRLEALPEVPTFAEAGAPNYTAPSWYGLFAPTGAPPDVIAKLNADVREVLSHPDVRARCAEIGFDPIASTPEELHTLLQHEIPKWAEILQTTQSTR
jgi:tripartite-type tricarboxylate transporter receptor subunit TctC